MRPVELRAERAWPTGRSAFAQDLLAGLAAAPKRLPSKYFYDERGSALFERICELPEYYPTRTELALLRWHAGEIAALMGSDATLVEFGAGALKKVELLLDALESPRAYVPLDISADFLQAMAADLRRRRPALDIHPVAADFTDRFALPVLGHGERRVGFFPGSTIGNLTREEAQAFLERAAGLLRGGGMLVGVDLVKDPALLHAAYNDAAGVTEAFNKNLLERANAELGADFDTDAFAHYAFYAPAERRIEMHLMSRDRQSVRVLGHRFEFAEGETIHTENSCKYTVQDFTQLARRAGFAEVVSWVDGEELFSLHWLAAAG
jgi:dimethylhistidine N-methyltransferase